jgi:peptidoglycan hydrolase-like protein with peptidoglycan-binding domain
VPAGTIVNLKFGEPVNVRSVTQRIYVLPETVAAAQRALRELGGYLGPIDGWLSTEIRQAIIQFQISHEQVPTGDLDEETARLLGVTPPER